MFKWKKLGRIFNPQNVTDRVWLQEYAQAPATLVFDSFVRVYFSCRPHPDEKGRYVSYSAFADFNRNDLTEIVNISKTPILELGKPGTFDEFGTYPVSVIRNGDHMLAYYAGWTRCKSVPFNVAIGVAKSTNNGETFTRLGDGPVLSYSIDEPFILSGPKIRRFGGRWYLFYIAGKKWIPTDGKPEPVYTIRMATSDDGINWTRQNKELIKPRIEENECQASPDVIFYQGKYHMFFSYRYSLDFRHNDRGYRIGYAVSEDLINWDRKDEMAGIDVSDEGWDGQTIAYPHVFELDGKVYIMYLGNDVGRNGFGLAELKSYTDQLPVL